MYMHLCVSARRPPVFFASHCWKQVLTIIQSSYGLLAHGSARNWVNALSHQQAGLVLLSTLCSEFQLSCQEKQVSFLERHELPLYILSLIFIIIIVASHLLLLFRGPT